MAGAACEYHRRNRELNGMYINCTMGRRIIKVNRILIKYFETIVILSKQFQNMSLGYLTNTMKWRFTMPPPRVLAAATPSSQ